MATFSREVHVVPKSWTSCMLKGKKKQQRKCSLCCIETCFLLERCWRQKCTIACPSIFHLQEHLFIDFCLYVLKVCGVNFFLLDIDHTVLPTLRFPVKVLCSLVYFYFFCSKLTSAIVDRTLHSPNKTKQKILLVMKAKVQVP